MLPFRRGGPGAASKFKISGTYQLEGYDANLEAWLNSMHINGAEMGQKFRNTKLKIMVKEPSKHNRKWSLTHKDDGGSNETVSYDFEPGKTLVNQGPDEVSERITCLPDGDDHTVIVCRTEVKEKHWNVESRVKFRPEGLTCTITSKPASDAKYPIAPTTMSMNFKKLVDPWTQRRNMMLKRKNKVK